MRFGRKYINSDLVGDSGFSKNWHSESHTFLTVVNEFLYLLSTFYFPTWTKFGILYLDIILLSIYEFR